MDVVLLSGFRKAIKKLFSAAELEALIEFLGNHPDKGDVIPGTGGLRKLRWALAGRGKRGGSRVIYYYARAEWQVLLLTAYAKNKKDDLSEGEKKLLAALVKNVLKQE
jgi:mRNA-degrading endonuclease RelE of RelBE toxin-antitoxin system